MNKITINLPQKGYGVREAIRSLRTNIQFCGDDKKVILVTSCLPGEGKSSVSLELCRAFAEMGKNTILVDADTRKSVLVSNLEINGDVKGLTHFLSGQCTLADSIVSTNISHMHMMIAGPYAPNPTELLESSRFHGMIDSMRNVYDYIIIDCPPLGLVIDAAIIAKEADGAIMIVESCKTKYRLAQDVRHKLEQSGVPILGCVLNKIEVKNNKGYYSKYYGKKYGESGYGEYYGHSDEKKRKKASKK